MLIRTFQVEIGRPRQFLPLLHHRRVTDAGIEPDVKDVFLLAEGRAATGGTGAPLGKKGGPILLEPEIRPFLLHPAGDFFEEVGGNETLAAVDTGEDRNRHAPGPLAGDAPVGAVGNHSRNPLFSPGRYPAHAVDFVE